MEISRPHPLDSPAFGSTINTPIWYMAHPIAPDEKYTFEQNMAHVVHMMRVCYDAGLRVVAPYHTICLALDDNDLEHRRIGLEVDCGIVQKLGRVIFVGHKMSSGMNKERETLVALKDFNILDLIKLNDESVKTLIRSRNNLYV